MSLTRIKVNVLPRSSAAAWKSRELSPSSQV